jgi:hypothetical protein
MTQTYLYENNTALETEPEGGNGANNNVALGDFFLMTAKKLIDDYINLKNHTLCITLP